MHFKKGYFSLFLVTLVNSPTVINGLLNYYFIILLLLYNVVCVYAVLILTSIHFSYMKVSVSCTINNFLQINLPIRSLSDPTPRAKLLFSVVLRGAGPLHLKVYVGTLYSRTVCTGQLNCRGLLD